MITKEQQLRIEILLKQIGDIYKNNEYGFVLGQSYRVDRESEVYLPNSETLEVEFFYFIN